MPFGAFVRVGNSAHGFEGLLYKSQLTKRTVNVGDLVTVKIAHVDVTRRTIELAWAPTER